MAKPTVAIMRTVVTINPPATPGTPTFRSLDTPNCLGPSRPNRTSLRTWPSEARNRKK